MIFLGNNKENQQPQDDQQNNNNNSEEGKNVESNTTGDVPQAQRQTTVADQVNQSSTPGDSRQ